MFICPDKKDAEKRTKILCELQDLLDTVKAKIPVPIQPIQQCYIPVPCTIPCPKSQNEHRHAEPPEVMVCYREKCKTKTHKPDSNAHHSQSDGEPLKSRVKQSKSRELRASCLYKGCDCEKKNGLQDQCPRTDCQGSPECLTKPNPICGPSEFCNAKHLEKKRDAFLKRKYGKKYGYEEVDQHGDQKESRKGQGDASVKYKCFPASFQQANGPKCYLVCECPK